MTMPISSSPRRPLGRLCYLLVSLLVAVSVRSPAQAPALTTITDTIYRANGDPAAGRLVISWPAFTTRDNRPVAAGELTVTLGAGGALSVQLAPNEGAQPAGSYYKVVYKLADGATASEYWVVPVASPALVGAIRATVVPTTVAAQLVTRQYVDNIVSGNDTSVVHRAGAETITGLKTFSASPAVPAPAAAGDAANKSYVDTAVAAAYPARVCTRYAGANAGAKIAACIADLPATGGFADACGFEGAGAIATTINVTRKTTLRLCGTQLVATVTPAFAVSADLLVEGSNRTVSSIQAAAGGVIFSGSGVVGFFGLRNLTLLGNASGSKALVTPAYGGGNDWSAGRVTLANNVVTDFGDYAFDFGQSTYFIDIREQLFLRNVGAINSEWASDIVIKESTFGSPAVSAAYPAGRPQIKLKGGAAFTIADSDFERNDSLRPTGAFQAADIFLEATSPSGSPGFGWIRNNKFGGEGESATRAKLQVASSSGSLTDAVFNVALTENSFYGTSGGSAQAVKLENPIAGFRFSNNYFSNFTTVIADTATLVSADAGHSVFTASNLIVPVGGTAPTGSVAIFANGGRYFSQVAGSALTADLEPPVTESPRPNETSEIRNRLAYSEALQNWTLQNVTITPGQADPFGGARAVLATAAGVAASDQLAASVENSARRRSLVVKFWAKAGTLNTLQFGLDRAGSFQGSLPTITLGAEWKQYKFAYNGLDPAAHNLRIYPGNGFQITPGSVYLFGVQVSDFDTDYVRTTGLALADTATGNRFERKAEFANQLTSTVATGTAPFVVGSTTKVANLNSDLLDGADWQAPAAIGSVTPNSAAFTTATAATVNATSGLQVNGAALAFTNLAGALATTQTAGLTGDVTSTAGTISTTVAKVNGVSYPATPATDTLPVITAANTATYKAVPSCLDSGGNHLNYDSATHAFSCGSSTGGNSASALSRPNTRRWSYVPANGSGGFSTVGDSNSATGSCSSIVAPTGNDAAMTNCTQSAATINTNAGINGVNLIYRTGRNVSLQFAGKVRESTSVRAWAGLTDQALATQLGSDNPAGNYAAFRFSTGASDANVKCVTKDGASQNLQASTVTDMSAYHVYEITEDVAGAKWHFYIDGAEVCGSGLTANLPAASTNLRYVAGQQNLTSSQRNMDIAWVQINSDK